MARAELDRIVGEEARTKRYGVLLRSISYINYTYYHKCMYIVNLSVIHMHMHRTTRTSCCGRASCPRTGRSPGHPDSGKDDPVRCYII